MKTMKFTFFGLLIAFFGIMVACEENEAEFVVDPLAVDLMPEDTTGGSDTLEDNRRLATLNIRVSLFSEGINDCEVEIYRTQEDRQDSVNQIQPNQMTRRMERGATEENGWTSFEFEMPDGVNRKTIYARATFTNPNTGETQFGTSSRDVLVNQEVDMFIQL